VPTVGAGRISGLPGDCFAISSSAHPCHREGDFVERELNAKEQKILLNIARQAIIDQVQTGQYEVEPREEKSLNSRSGCFVSIKQNGKLRGCIGNFQSSC